MNFDCQLPVFIQLLLGVAILFLTPCRGTEAAQPACLGPGEVWEDANLLGAWCISKCPRPVVGVCQFLGYLGDQIPTCRVPHSLPAVMLG